MLRTLLTAKIHRCTVTQSDLHYVGSLTVDADLLDAADLIEGEQVHVVDIDNGSRFLTYVIPGPRGSGIIGANGAAARMVHTGDKLIVMAYGQFETAEARAYSPRVVHVDDQNRIVDVGSDPAEPSPSDPTLIRGDATAR